MKKSMCLLGAMVLAMGFADLTQAARGPRRGPDLTQLALNAIAAVQDQAGNYSEDVVNYAYDAADRIQALRDAGKSNQADSLAQRTLNQINRRNNMILRGIEWTANVLANLLARFGEDDLAAEVLTAFDDAASQIQAATDEAIAVIENDGDGSSEPAE
jgi:hypothetical protein